MLTSPTLWDSAHLQKKKSEACRDQEFAQDHTATEDKGWGEDVGCKKQIQLS